MLETIGSIFGLNGEPPIVTIGQALFAFAAMIAIIILVQLLRQRRTRDRALLGWASARDLQIDPGPDLDLVWRYAEFEPMQNLFRGFFAPRSLNSQASNIIRGRWRGLEFQSFDCLCWIGQTRAWPKEFSAVALDGRERPPVNAVNHKLLDSWDCADNKTRVLDFWVERHHGKLLIYNGSVFSLEEYQAALDLAVRILGSRSDEAVTVDSARPLLV